MSRKMLLSLGIVGSLLVAFIIFMLIGKNSTFSNARLSLIESLPISTTSKNTLITKFNSNSISVDPEQQKKVLTKESNSPRGTFVSYANNTLTVTDDTGKQNTIAGNVQAVTFSCVKDDNQTTGGKKFSLYDSYINVSGFDLSRQNKLFPGESFLNSEQTKAYSGSKIIYVTRNSPGVVQEDVDIKVVFLGCKK